MIRVALGLVLCIAITLFGSSQLRADTEPMFAGIPWGSSFETVSVELHKKAGVILEPSGQITDGFNMYYEDSEDGYLGWLISDAHCQITIDNRVWNLTALFDETDKLVEIELWNDFQANAQVVYDSMRKLLISKYGTGFDVPANKEKFYDYEFEGFIDTKYWTFNTDMQQGNTRIALKFAGYPKEYSSDPDNPYRVVSVKYTNRLFEDCAVRAKAIADSKNNPEN